MLVAIDGQNEVATFLDRKNVDVYTRNVFAAGKSISCIRELNEDETKFINLESNLINKLYSGEGQNYPMLMSVITVELDHLYDKMKNSLRVKQINIGLNP